MKPPAFDYAVAHTAQEAVDLLAADPSARVLAGGQSLLLELAYREQRPSRLVDINPVAELARLEDTPDGLRIGALVRHDAFERTTSGDPVLRLLAKAAPYVAHPPIRARGTFCGTVAWGHPAAEWNAVLAGLGGAVELLGPAGRRDVPAAEWFVGPLQTAARAGELVVGVRLPRLPEGTGVGFAELRRTHASFALVAAAVAVTVTDGVVTGAHVGLADLDLPTRAAQVEAALVGRPPDATAVQVAGPDRYRAAAATELVRRALTEAFEEAA